VLPQSAVDRGHNLFSIPISATPKAISVGDIGGIAVQAAAVTTMTDNVRQQGTETAAMYNISCLCRG